MAEPIEPVATPAKEKRREDKKHKSREGHEQLSPNTSRNSLNPSKAVSKAERAKFADHEMTLTDRNLISFLEDHNTNIPHKHAITWISDEKGAESPPVTYRTLWRSVGQVAHLLLNKYGLKKGDRVLLLFEPGPQFIQVFYGCLNAGIIAIPLYPPINLSRDIPKIMKIFNNCQPKLILVTAQVKNALTIDRVKRKAKGALGSSNVGMVDLDLPSDLVKELEFEQHSDTCYDTLFEADRVLFLQYTSGSTGDPKGVMITMANLAHNHAIVNASAQLTAEDTLVSWLPLYHDMGLIGALMQPLRVGASFYCMSPVTFIRNPSLFIEKVSEHKSSIIVSPNFGYMLLARKWHGKRSIDLTNVRYCCIAAERIFPATIQKFTDTFAPYGFRGEAFNPMYGLAEHTLFVTDKDAPLEHVTVVDDNYVACGAPKRGVDVRIVNPDTRVELPGGEVGEIWVDSPSKALGYWNDQERTDGTFFARISGQSSARAYLRTGDLGKMSSGQLVITGRIKEIIILRGRNFHPEDIEFAAQQASDQLRPGCVAAFHVDGSSGERLVIVAESREDTMKQSAIEEVAGLIRREVQASLAIEVWRIVIISPRSIPKTSSGKLQRLLCKQMLLKNELKVIGDSNTDNIRGSRKRIPASPEGGNTILQVEGEEEKDGEGADDLLAPIGEDEVANKQKEIAQCADVDSRAAAIVRLITNQLTSMGITISDPSVQSLWESGLDSIRAIELKATLERVIGISLPTSVFYDNASISDLSRSLAEMVEDEEEDEGGAAEDEAIPEAGWWKVALCSLGQIVMATFLAFLLIAAAWPILKLAVYLSKFKLLYALIFLPGGYVLYGLELAIGIVLLKWILIGKYSAGEHPLWGWFYIRWWTVDRAIAFTNPLFMDYFKGTPVLNIWYMALGVKCSVVDYIDTTLLTEFDLISIGRNSAVNTMARICPHSFTTRAIRMGSIELQPGSYIGPRALLTPLNGTENAQYLYVQPLTSKDLPPPNLKRASAAFASNTDIEANQSDSCCSFIGVRNVILGSLTAFIAMIAITGLSVAITYACYRFAAWIAFKTNLTDFEFVIFKFGPIVRTAPPFDAQDFNLGYIVTCFLFLMGPLFLPFLFVIVMVESYTATLAVAKQKYLIELLWLLPLAYICYLLTLAVCCIALKWAIGWRLGRNEMNVWGFHYYRRWVAAFMIAWSWARLSVFYSGTYLSALWWRALGMQVGFGVTIANFVPPIEPDLIQVGDSATIGDYSLLATRTVRNGIAISRAVTVGKASTVGGHSVMLPGSRMGNNTILGALSYVPEDFSIPADASAFVGAPARGLNLQQAGGLNAPLSDFNEWSFGCLDVVDFAYALFAVPLLLLLLAFVAYPNFLLTQYFYHRWGWGIGVALVPAAWLGYIIALIIVLVVVKWTIFWRVREDTVKLRSMFYWRRLFFLMTYYLCVTVFLPLIQGTVYFNFLLSALGAKVSPRAIVNTVLITEPDLVELGRNVVVANGSVLHGHLVQKGKMELGPLTIQENCVIGPHCFLLIGSTLQSAVRLHGVSLVMKQDTLVSNKTYGGSPCGIIVRARRRQTRAGTQS